MSGCAEQCPAEGQRFSLPWVTTHAAAKAATKSCAVKQQTVFRLSDVTQFTLCITSLLNSRNQHALIFLFILHVFFFLTSSFLFFFSACLLSRARAMEAAPSNVVVFFLYPVWHHCVYLRQPLIYTSPFCVTTHNHRNMEMWALITSAYPPRQAEQSGCSLGSVTVLCIAQKPLRESTRRGKCSSFSRPVPDVPREVCSHPG